MRVFLFQTFVEGHRFFEQYEMIFTALKQAAEVYVKSDSSSKTLFCFISNFFVIYILYSIYYMYCIYVDLSGLMINSLIIDFMLQGLRPVTMVSPKTVRQS